MTQADSRHRVDVSWQGGRKLTGGPPGGPQLRVDGGREAAPSPVEAMVIALASCSAIDVVEILQKRRTPVEMLKVEVDYTRAPTAPRRLTQVTMRYVVTTTSERHHVERAIQLSFDTYCSVTHSLDPALPISWELELLPTSGTPAP